MGSDARGRRHTSPAWLDMITDQSATARGRKLVVQVVETFQKGGQASIVEALDAVEVGRKAGMKVAPVMIYGDDVTHLVTEEGVAYLYKAQNLEERRAAIAAIAGATEVGLRAVPQRTAELRSRGVVATPDDLGVRRSEARRTLLAARSIDDLVAWSGGLYQPPARFRSW
jgi:malonate decarboxylase alpha subunit